MSCSKTKNKNSKSHGSILQTVLIIGLIIYVICLFVPLIWAVITSFKDNVDFRINIIGLPEKWVWNYSYVFSKFYVLVSTLEGAVRVGMGKLFLNALLYAVGCAYFSTLVPCIVSYLCARFNFVFSKIVHTIVVVAMILPIVGKLPAEISMARSLGLYDSIMGMWVMHAHFLGLYFLIFYSYFQSMPMAYTEAAQIDGASNLMILLKIILPMAKNTFFTVMILQFIVFWNDYQIPLVYLPTKPTIALGMYQMAYTTENTLSTIPMRMSAAILMLTPILILFLTFHKRLLGNITVGGIKG